jgi:hypothetical protein
MPGSPSDTFYDLAIRAIEEQEREVNGLRARTGTIVAAGAVAATLLAREVFAGSHPDGSFEWIVTGVGLAGLAVVLLASVYLLRSHDLSFSIDAREAYERAGDRGILDLDDVEVVRIDLVYNLSDMQGNNSVTVKRLRKAFAAALGGLVVEIIGLGLGAALA